MWRRQSPDVERRRPGSAVMNGLLVRVAADQSRGGGYWNGPVDSRTRDFVYVPIPERKAVRAGHARPYGGVVPSLTRLGVALPAQFHDQRMHLDPDFEHLTYGDQGPKGKQLVRALSAGDVLVFYSGLMDVVARHLVYAIIGLLVVERVDRAVDWRESEWHRNAHTRRELGEGADDVIVVGRARGSGRLARCIPIGEYREKAYRVRRELLVAWGDITSNNGYLQRSAVFPRLLDAGRFMGWLERQGVEWVRQNF